MKESYIVNFTSHAHKLEAARLLDAKKGIEVDPAPDTVLKDNAIRVVGPRLTSGRLIQMIRDVVTGGRFIHFVIKKEAI